MINTNDILDGRWGLSRITLEDGMYCPFAYIQRLADDIQCFYPPLNVSTGTYPIDVCLVRLRGNVQAPVDGNTVLFPRDLATVGDVQLSELTQGQRDALSNVLTNWLPAYNYTDPRTDQTVNKSAFSSLIAGYTGNTTLKEVARDIYRYFGHAKVRT